MEFTDGETPIDLSLRGPSLAPTIAPIDTFYLGLSDPSSAHVVGGGPVPVRDGPLRPDPRRRLRRLVLGADRPGRWRRTPRVINAESGSDAACSTRTSPSSTATAASWPSSPASRARSTSGAATDPGAAACGIRCMPRPLARTVALAELHCHLGGAVTPAIMWGIAHAQGIRLPTKDYWEFRDMITVSRVGPVIRRLPAALPLDGADPELAASPLNVRSTKWSAGRTARTTSPRWAAFNPMKRNRGGEQDLDHIIAAAVRGADRAMLEYPVKPGLFFCLDRAFPYSSTRSSSRRRSRGTTGASWASTSPDPNRPRSASPTIGTCSVGAPVPPLGSRSTRVSPDPWRKSRASWSSWSPTKSGTASRRPTTRVPWR